MRTSRLLIAATAAALTIVSLASCSSLNPVSAVDTVTDPGSTTAKTAAPRPDGRYNTPLESHAGGGTYASANWVRLPDGRKVLCVSDETGGFDCNWDDIRPKDTK